MLHCILFCDVEPLLGFILFCFVVLNLQIPLPELADCHRTEMGY
jgi:hypothetical protein